MWRSATWHDLRVPLLTLASASALGVTLVGARTILSWQGHHLYLVWNLFLAWIPVLLAVWLEERDRKGTAKDWRFWAMAFAWLMFFPNAPYILTDLSHLKFATRMHWWTDLILILLFAFTGLVLAFVSLHRMHSLVSRRRGGVTGWVFVFGVAILSGFGVYLGRFKRWNSWDVILNPVGLFKDSLNWLQPYSAGFTLLFGLLLFTAYAMLHSLTRLGQPSPAPASDRSISNTRSVDSDLA